MSQLDRAIKKSRRDLEKIDRLYDEEMARLRKAKASAEEIQIAHSEFASEHEVEEYLFDSLLTRKFRERAKQLDVSLPPYPQYDKDADSDENEFWYRDPVQGVYSLKRKGREYMDEVIWKKEERQHNRRIRWVTLGIGLTGAVTGLVSVVGNNWEKIARLLSGLRH